MSIETENQPAARRSLARYALPLIPLAIFLGFAAVAGKMLYDQDVNGRDVSAIPSALIGKKAPSLALPPLEGSNTAALTTAAIAGKLTLVNVFASWCVPCRQEFPVLQKLSARYGKKVAFIGVNSEDDEAAAKTFLREEPVPYPSYTDRDKAIARSLGASVGLPDTAFFDEQGKLVYLKQGPYAHDSELEEDVRKYALQSG